MKIGLSEKDKLAFEMLSRQGPLGKRIIDIMQYFFLRYDFKEFICDIRKILNIPEDGLSIRTEEELFNYINKYLDGGYIQRDLVIQSKFEFPEDVRLEIYIKINNYIDGCGLLRSIPSLYLANGFIYEALKEYILFNSFPLNTYKGQFALTTIEEYDENMTGNEDQQTSYEIKIAVPISAKKEEIISYIDHTWKNLDGERAELLEDKDIVRFKPKNNFFRDLLILEIYQEIESLSKSKRKSLKIDYIELGVIKALKTFHTGKIPSDGTIRSIVSKLKKEIKEINSFIVEKVEDKEYEPFEDYPTFIVPDFLK